MKAIIRHEIPGRLRVHFARRRLSFREADTLHYHLANLPGVESVQVYERTADAVIRYSCDRGALLAAIRSYDPAQAKAPPEVLEASGRAQQAAYRERIIASVVLHFGKRLLLPGPVRRLLTWGRALRFLWRGLRTIPQRRLRVELLDATAIGASVLSRDHGTADSVMFLLDVGDTLEEWTHKKSVSDLARQMSLHVSRVWRISGDTEALVDAGEIREGDLVMVRVGSLIPFDGVVARGEAMVNQASMTGEPIPVRRSAGKSVFAGTVVEEGELVVRVTKVSGSGRFDKIVHMIEESEKLKSNAESKAETLADRLVPYTLAGAALTWLLTRDVRKAVAVLMVDYSCALKLAMPISVLSAIREAGSHHITVKGGRFLEAVAEADTIVFDKTGTLTKAQPAVREVISFNGADARELLREAACLEEHFPHSIANAVVRAAAEQDLQHEELHAEVEYIVAHGIASTIAGKRALIGSRHFIFEDEGVEIPEGERERFEAIPEGYSPLYYAKDGQLAAVLLIEDPVKEGAARAIEALHREGVARIVMMTGDSEGTAQRIAASLGIDEVHAEVLPEDKARFVQLAKREGARVIMVGDGINDSPALSAADAGVAISSGAELARQIADITVGRDDLEAIVALRRLSELLMRRIHFNYRMIVGVNTALILLSMAGILPPATSALLHNASTLALGLKSTTKLL